MPSPFPGMDPYLEKPALWPDIHQRIGDKLSKNGNCQVHLGNQR